MLVFLPTRADSVADLYRLLDRLLAENLRELREHPEIPPIYESGVRYQREEPGHEEWQPILVTLSRGYGDCEDLASWRLAELHHTGEDRRAKIGLLQRGNTFHVVVVRWNGQTEDPSRRLGM